MYWVIRDPFTISLFVPDVLSFSSERCILRLVSTHHTQGMPLTVLSDPDQPLIIHGVSQVSLNPVFFGVTDAGGSPGMRALRGVLVHAHSLLLIKA